MLVIRRLKKAVRKYGSDAHERGGDLTACISSHQKVFDRVEPGTGKTWPAVHWP